MRAVLLALLVSGSALRGATESDLKLAEYFRHATSEMAQRCLADVRTSQDWEERREPYRQQLLEMLSLEPLPERNPLRAQITGRLEHDAFTVEKLHFQSLPGLYVTANLYLPRKLQGPAPTVLYLCGHGAVITNGVSYGNKVTYQHHGAWFARHGYVCLLIDTLQLGEIQGLHHGTYRERLWWWNARGYTPAGVEAWNSIRALDYLSTRAEVDTNRFGVTGRSGGGAYSWWLAALDDRVRAAAPVAGITDLENHVVDGVVEGHCDCMFTINTYRWDYPQVAALVAPRPLLIVNTDADYIFPLEGVLRTHEKVRTLYRLYNVASNLGLVIGPGPHKDTQDLQVPVFRWFNRHLRGEDSPVEAAATKYFTPQQLKVFASLPADALNSNIHGSFVASAKRPPAPTNSFGWRQHRASTLRLLRAKAFGAWPEEGSPAASSKGSGFHNGVRLEVLEFLSEPHQSLRMYVSAREEMDKPDRVVLRVLGEPHTENNRLSFIHWLNALKGQFPNELAAEIQSVAGAVEPGGTPDASLAGYYAPTGNVVLAVLAPRGMGVGRWAGDARKQAQIRRRFMLLGRTLDSARVWDIRQAMRLLRERWPQAALAVEAAREMSVNAAYAALFEPNLAMLSLQHPPASHMEGPDYLNVLRITDVPEIIAFVADSNPVRIATADRAVWEYPEAVARQLGWPEGRLQIVATE